MSAQNTLHEAGEKAMSGDFNSAMKLLKEIDPRDLSERERQRLEAGKDYCQGQMAATSQLARIIHNLRRASSDPSLWDSRPQSDGPAPYLPWKTVSDLLDQHAPGWKFRVTSIIENERSFIVTTEIEIAGATRQASSYSNKFGKRRDGTEFAYSKPHGIRGKARDGEGRHLVRLRRQPS